MLLDDFETADFEKMSEIRARVDDIVTDQQGASAYFRYIRQWRNSGDFAGLQFSRE
jgi:hypothetical protein